MRAAAASVVGFIGSLARRGLSPHELALAVAMGAVCAFFPILGLATPLGLAAGAALRLNHCVIQGINALTAPLYPLAVLGFAAAGGAMMGGAGRGFALTSFLEHALIGWAASALVGFPLLYLATRLAHRVRRRRSLPS